MLKEKKHKIIFSSILKSLVSEEKDKLLAIASVSELQNFIPKVDNRNHDLLPFATSAFVANHANLNGAIVGTKEAVETAELFINKQVNLNHNRNKVRGVILTVGFSEFGTEKPISKEDALKSNDPFNITVGGILWRVVDENLAQLIEETNDPSSEYFQAISSSFEVSFDEFDIVKLPKKSRYLSDGEIITDIEQKAKLTPLLKTFGGDGILDKEHKIAILVKGEVLPLGIGLTENPAAAVKGIAIFQEAENDDDQDKKTQTDATNTQIISQSNDLNVIPNTNLINKDMPKLTNIKEITDEALKTNVITASAIHELIESELKTASEQWAKEKAEKEALLQTTQTKHNEVAEINKNLAKEVEELKASLEKLKQEKAAKEAQETFNTRMTHFDEKYELTKEDRQVIAAQIKDLNDDQFKVYEQNIAVLLASKNKELIAASKKIVTTASTTTTETPSAATVVDDLVSNATQTTPPPVATTSTQATSLLDKFKALAANDHVELNFRGKK